MWLTTRLQTIAQERRDLAQLKAERDVQMAAFMEQNKELYDRIGVVERAVAADEEDVRRQALAYYQSATEAPDRKCPAPGVTVKVFQVVTYNPREALAWARSSGLALALDKAAFERIAKGSYPEGPDWEGKQIVQMTEEPRCQIATDLDAALKKEGQP